MTLLAELNKTGVATALPARPKPGEGWWAIFLVWKVALGRVTTFVESR